MRSFACSWRVVVAAVAVISTGTSATAQPPTPTLLSVTAEAGLVTFAWTRAADQRTTYTVDAGSAPGLSDLAQGVALYGRSGWSVGQVPAGTYFVRIRAVLLGQVSTPSNELAVTVPGCPAPIAPAFTAQAVGQTVVVNWDLTPKALGCWPTALALEVGASPGAADLAILDVPDFSIAQRTFAAVPVGRYYVRARVTHPGYPPVSTNEVRLDVGCVPPPAILNATVATVGNAARFSWSYDLTAGSAFALFLEAGSSQGAADIGAVAVPPEASYGFNVAGAAGRYFTRVRAVNACGTTVSADVPVTLTSDCVLPDPIDFIDADMTLGAGNVNVRWDAPRTGGLVMRYDTVVGTSPGASDLGARTVDGRATPFVSFFSETFPTAAPRTYTQVLPVNHCGPAPRAALAHAVVGVCRNPPAPHTVSAAVSGTAVTLLWSGTGELEQSYPTYVEIGSRPGAADVLVSPPRSSYGTPQFATSLPAGRYYARARRTAPGCDEVSNPSAETTFVVP